MVSGFPKDTSKYTLIVSDFDGTLAGLDHMVSQKVADAVKKWVEGGKHFSIATGRQFLMIEEECQKMGLVDPVIVRGGAEVVDPTIGKVLHSEMINEKDVVVINEYLQQQNLFLYSIERDDVIYSNFHFEIDHWFTKVNFKDLSEFTPSAMAKFHVKPKVKNDPKTDEVIKKIGLRVPSVHAIATHNNTFGKGWDITSTSATKLHGIVKVMDILNVEKDQIVGVGDSYNDFPLLEAAGLKVAMGNAHQELKEIADVIVPSHDQDGVAVLIEELLRNSKS